MADFCYQCTEYLFGKEFADRNELSGLCEPTETVVNVLCEGCGIIEVDSNGVRIQTRI